MHKLILMASMLITGCATTVHINNQYLDQDEYNRLSNELRNAGYKVKKSNTAFPSEVAVNTIIYFPSSKSSAELSELQTILETNGYPVFDIAAGVKGNHHYTKSNIGIYVIPNGVSVDDAAKLYDTSIVDAEFISKACGGVTVLDILPEGRYLIENLSEPKKFQNITGAWKISEFNNVQFAYQGKVYTYTISKFQTDYSDHIERDIILMPAKTDTLPLSCVYQYVEKEFRY